MKIKEILKLHNQQWQGQKPPKGNKLPSAPKPSAVEVIKQLSKK